jgi:fumarate reductase (CoM/CoB) subunit A
MRRLDVLQTDVLVIGAGAAALRAAIAAHEENVRVMIVCKGVFPSGCTPRAMGAMQAVYHPKDSPATHLRDTVIGGRFINDQGLVQQLVNHSREAAEDLERFGTVFVKEDGKYRLDSFGGYSFPRAILTSEPYAGGFIKGLIRGVRELGIDVVEETMVTRLLNSERLVTGAIGFNVESGSLFTVAAKSTVLATGGAGSLYSLTTNPPDVTGDGYVMAYDVAAELIDMEFVQTRACIVYPATLKGRPPPADGLANMGGRFYNAIGERFMKKYDGINIEKVTRDRVAICTHKEISEGRATAHKAVYNDLSGVPSEELGRFQSFLKGCKEAGIDPTWQPIEWAPGAHYFMGGVRINESGETNVKGLFCCGEVTGGIHGANRVTANSLTDALVFGAIAGKSAARHALTSSSREISEKQVQLEKERLFNLYEGKNGIDYIEIRTKLQSVADDYVGVVRKERDLRKAIDELKRLSEQVQHSCILGKKNYRELAKLIETVNLIKVGEMVARAALERTESRGAHYREDFPTENNRKWLKNILINLQDDRMTLSTVPSRTLYVTLPPKEP